MRIAADAFAKLRDAIYLQRLFLDSNHLAESPETGVHVKSLLFSTNKSISALAYRSSSVDRIHSGTLSQPQLRIRAMITDARSRGNLIAALHLQPSISVRRGSDENNGARRGNQANHYSTERAAVELRHRLAFVQSLAVTARGSSIKTDMAAAATTEKDNATRSRATANVAAWRSYLPEDCVVAMINGGWHWST